MKKFEIPNYGKITIENIIFDINGTLQFKGKISEELIKKFEELKQLYNVYLVSSDTRGNLEQLANKLGASVKTILNADLAFPNPISAIDLLLDEKIMIATLR